MLVENNDKIILYFCDPEKNTQCEKDECYSKGRDGKCTLNIEFAKLNAKGKPIIALGVNYTEDD